ncbi:alpha/beta fold hydrolase [Spongiimicrobium salis]|uniref:alpha/beta fold hydrolase n=1 Tax=Spongiimicrobium salis TaxID=1667022 RepID=UPI00374D4EBD
MSNPKIQVYFMPGMAANPSIFDHIVLDGEKFEKHLLEWTIPERGMSLKDYALIMCNKIEHKNPVLIGVSFGGMLVQEMAKHIPVRKLIIVSSVKQNKELPKRMKFARRTKIYKLLPTSLVSNIHFLNKFAFGGKVNKRLELYEQYLSVKDKYYIDWSIDQIVNWEQSEYDDCLIHIHGEKDPVFPIKYIKNCIPVKNGTHTMIIHRYKWFNEHLPTIILE